MPAGVIQRFPLGLHEHALLEVRPSRAYDIGLGKSGVGGRSQIRGGSLGLIVDTRGRPLALPEDKRRRVKRLQQWLGSLINGDEPGA